MRRNLHQRTQKAGQCQAQNQVARHVRAFSPWQQWRGNLVTRTCLLTTVSAFAAILGAQGAQAQGTQAQPEQNKQAEEIVVTAQRRSENIQKVPVAVSVVSGDEILKQHIISPEQLQYSVPSLQEQSINNRVGAINFYIRGVGTTIFGPAAEASVLTVI